MNLEIGSWRPNWQLAHALQPKCPAEPEHHYLYADEQKRVFLQMSLNFDVIVAMALRGNPSKLIAAGFGVSREAIDRRLRPLGFKNPPGVRGRPRIYPPASSR
jgi:hypothetical protein